MLQRLKKAEEALAGFCERAGGAVVKDYEKGRAVLAEIRDFLREKIEGEQPEQSGPVTSIEEITHEGADNGNA